MAEAEISEALAAHLWDRRCKLIYKVRLSIVYNLRRQRFFEAVDKWATLLVAVSATAAVGALLKKTGGELQISVLTAVLALAQVVFNPAEKARKHSEASAQYRRLLASCEAAGEHWTAEQCNAFAAQAVEIEALEDAPLRALLADCQNQLNMGQGNPQDVVKLTFWQRRFMHCFDFDPVSIAARK